MRTDMIEKSRKRNAAIAEYVQANYLLAGREVSQARDDVVARFRISKANWYARIRPELLNLAAKGPPAQAAPAGEVEAPHEDQAEYVVSIPANLSEEARESFNRMVAYIGDLERQASQLRVEVTQLVTANAQAERKCRACKKIAVEALDAI